MTVMDGRGSATPYATWDPNSSCWRTCVVTLFQQEQGEPSGTFPTSGTTRSGRLYERPTWVPRTVGSVGSALPTPRATDGPKGGPGQVNGRGEPDSLPAIGALLPTPNASVANDGEKAGTWLARAERLKEKHGNGNGAGMPLTIAVQLLPTPIAMDSRSSGGSTPQAVTLTDAVVRGKGPGATMSPPSDGGSTS